ncbi:MAG: insulinase family protein [Bacteroidales bacterium]|nr:insulinase family protein [Bacteroidales bacterium]
MIYTKTLDSGLQLAFRRTRSQVAYAALAIKSGTSNEPAAHSGIAHMTEHMLFKGTLKRTPAQISNRLEVLGGELNAYTAKEETVLYSTVLKEDASKAADLMLELAFTSTFPQKELEKERSVVIDEINMYKDSPSECIFEEFEKLLFAPSPLERPILGTARSLAKMTSADLVDYVKANFLPENMCLSLVGDFTPQRAWKIMEQAAERYIPSGYRPAAPAPALAPCSLALAPVQPFFKEVSKKNHQINCIIGTTVFPYRDSRRMELVLLSNILGGPGSNSRLNQKLREKNALVYSIDCSVSQFIDNGSVMIYFGCEKPNLDKCISLVRGELAQLRDKPLTERALRTAKKQLLGQFAVSSDNGEAQALSMAKSMLVYGNIMSDEELRRRILAITAEGLQEVAAATFAEDRLCTLIFK